MSARRFGPGNLDHDIAIAGPLKAFERARMSAAIENPLADLQTLEVVHSRTLD